MEPKEVKIVVNEEYLQNLKRQKLIIIAIQSSGILPENLNQDLDGILGGMDEIQDQLCDVHGIPQEKVFNLGEKNPEFDKIVDEINGFHRTDKEFLKVAKNYFSEDQMKKFVEKHKNGKDLINKLFEFIS